MSIATDLSSTLGLGQNKIDEIIKIVLDRIEREGIEYFMPLIKNEQKTKRVSRSVPMKTTLQKEMKLSFLRGKRVFELCQKYPFLLEQASCRQHVANIKRNQIWEKVTVQINKEFKSVPGFEPISVAQARKLEDYYRRRCQPDTPLSAELLSAIGQTSVAPPSPKKVNLQDIDIERLREERLNFMVILIKEIMKHTGLDRISNARTIDINTRRSAMWKFVKETVNNRYMGRLDVLIEAQVKKSYSNYKRRHPEFQKSPFMVIGKDLEVTSAETDEIERVFIQSQCNTSVPSSKLENSGVMQTELGKNAVKSNAVVFGKVNLQ